MMKKFNIQVSLEIKAINLKIIKNKNNQFWKITKNVYTSRIGSQTQIAVWDHFWGAFQNRDRQNGDLDEIYTLKKSFY